MTLFEPEEAPRQLFGIVGYNISRCLQISANLFRVGRELNYYTDLDHKAPIHTWKNSQGESVPVVHVANDPVVTPLSEAPLQGLSTPFATLVSVEVPLFYPHPLAHMRWSSYNTQAHYQAGEYFTFVLPKGGGPWAFTWNRVGPLLPWMKMPDSRGHLVYTALGAEMKRDDVPLFIQEAIETQLKSYRNAPGSITGPSQTSWTYFREHVKAYENGDKFPIPDPS